MRLGICDSSNNRGISKISRRRRALYQLGALSATSGRIVCIAVHVSPVSRMQIEGLEHNQREHVFGIDADGFEEDEKRALTGFLNLLKDFDPDRDEIVGHNILGFDLPFVFQRCLVNNISVRPFIDLSEFNVRGVFDTMHQWWLGSKRNVSLDDIACPGIESSKTAEARKQGVRDVSAATRRDSDYNYRRACDTKIYERMVSAWQMIDPIDGFFPLY